MRVFSQVLIGALLAGFGGAQDVQYNFDQQADFSRFRTYKWVDLPGGQQIDSLLQKDVRASFDAALAQRGLTKAEAGTADLYIAYQVAVNQEKELTAYTSGWGYGPGWRAGPGIGTASTSTILIGTVALDMYNIAQKQLVWRGTVTKVVDTKASSEKRRKNMAKAFDKLLRNYPPGRTS